MDDGPIIAFVVLAAACVGLTLGLLFGNHLGEQQQFTKDCKTMLHATVDGKSVCVLNGKVVGHS